MTSVEQLLARALMEILIAIDLTDDNEIDPDVATKIVEPIAALLQGAPDEHRQKMVELFHQCANDETEPERRTIALDTPDALGLQ